MKRLTITGLIVLLLCAVAAYLFWTINYASAPSITELSESAKPAATTLSSRIIADSDLPPTGTRSLFDHLITNNDGLPFPFGKFIDLIQQASPDGAPPLTLLVPSGRSLLKGQTDNRQPRIVLAADFQSPNTPAGLGLATQGQLFMAFVEEANEIEVLSYNEAAGRFEFQLVQNYCEGCVPRIVYARRAICLTCHQGGAPIFSQRPWNETNGQLAVSSAIRQARGGMEPYFGAPIEQALAVSERFDELTDIGNFYVVSQHLWLDGCGEQGNECRRTLLALALRYADQPGLFDARGSGATQLRALQANSFPAEGIEVAESDLKNRDPLGDTGDFSEWLYALFTTDIAFGEGAKDNEDLSAFEELPPLPPALDPLTRRAPKTVLDKASIDGVYGIARFFTDADLQTLNAHYANGLEGLLARVAELPADVFAAEPFSRLAMMEALLGEPRQYCCMDVSEMSAPQVSGVPELIIVDRAELHPFEQYCFTCHRGAPSKRLDFMSGEGEQNVLENIQAKSEIREALDWERYRDTDKAAKIMPPTDSVQYRMLEEAGEGVRKEMRETVPSMFGF